MRGSLTTIWADNRVDRRLQWIALIASVPDQSESARGPQHAVDLVQRHRTGEPVKRLRRRDHVDGCIGAGDRFGGSLENLHIRGRTSELEPHGRHRFDRYDSGPGGAHHPAEFPGARPWIDGRRDW